VGEKTHVTLALGNGWAANMAEDLELEISVLNIFSDPHPEGIYPRILTRIARKHAQIWGHDYVAISKPERKEAGLYSGRIYVWTALDPDSPAINLDDLEEVKLSDTDISVPDNMGLNGRIFNYVLREKDHKIFFESKNELGKRLSPYRLIKPLERLLMPINARGELDVKLNVQPEEDALEKVLGIPRIGVLEIHLKKPNPDDNDLDTEAILKELEEQGASKQDIKFTAKSRKKGLKPNHRTKVQCETAAETGYVKASGKDAANQPISLSTEEYPKTIAVPLDGIASAVVALMRIARDTVVRVRNRRAGPP